MESTKGFAKYVTLHGITVEQMQAITGDSEYQLRRLYVANRVKFDIILTGVLQYIKDNKE